MVSILLYDNTTGDLLFELRTDGTVLEFDFKKELPVNINKIYPLKILVMKD